jgi:hypothetical protein
MRVYNFETVVKDRSIIVLPENMRLYNRRDN